jgi:hypothetical protein
LPPPLASTLLVDALLLGLLAAVRGDVTLACAALALLAALRTVRVARRTSTGARRAVALGVALSMAGEAGLAGWRASTVRTGAVAAAVLAAAVYAWVTSPALRR